MKRSESKWRSLIEEQESSGQTVREFAETRGIAATTLYWWRSELKRRSPDLVPVEVIPEVEFCGAECPEGFDLHFPGGLRVQVPQGFDANELRRLVSVLQC